MQSLHQKTAPPAPFYPNAKSKVETVSDLLLEASFTKYELLREYVSYSTIFTIRNVKKDYHIRAEMAYTLGVMEDISEDDIDKACRDMLKYLSPESYTKIMTKSGPRYKRLIAWIKQCEVDSMKKLKDDLKDKVATKVADQVIDLIVDKLRLDSNVNVTYFNNSLQDCISKLIDNNVDYDTLLNINKAL